MRLLWLGILSNRMHEFGAVISGGLHIRMPDSICDVKLLKKSLEENKKIIDKADKKITKAAQKIKKGSTQGRKLHFFLT